MLVQAPGINHQDNRGRWSVGVEAGGSKGTGRRDGGEPTGEAFGELTFRRRVGRLCVARG